MEKLGIRGIAVLACCAGILLAPSAVGAAEGGKRITGPEVVRIFQDLGYKAQLDKDGEGDPMVRSKMGGLNVYLYFYDCKEAACGSLKFRTGLDLPEGTTHEVVNRYNSQYRYGNAFLDDEMDPYLEFDFEVLHTDHAAHIESQVDLWEELLDNFARETGFRSSGEASPESAAPETRMMRADDPDVRDRAASWAMADSSGAPPGR